MRGVTICDAQCTRQPIPRARHRRNPSLPHLLMRWTHCAVAVRFQPDS